jgi:hypothetical protein
VYRIALMALGCLCASELAQAADKWSITLHSLVLSGDGLDEVALLSADFEDAGLVGVALARRVGEMGRRVDLELEGQVAKHFGDQDHVEFTAALMVRWLPFPWDARVDTSFAGGVGLSFASEIPEIEERNHEDTARLLGYMVFEAAFSDPRLPQWSLVARLHHRSGVFGIFHDVRGASNGLGVGIKFRF